MPIELAPAEEEPGTTAPGTETPVGTPQPAAGGEPAVQPDGQQPATTPEKKPEEKVEAKPDEGRVVELSRGKRAAETERDTYKSKLTELEGELSKWKPVHELVGLAATDPLEFITQLADATGLSPEKVQEAIATRGAGGKVNLSAEDRLAALERQIRERNELETKNRDEADKAAKNARYVENRKANVAATAKFVKDNAKDFPVCEADGQEAIEAIYDTFEDRWMKLEAAGQAPRDQAGVQALYREAGVQVEKVLRAETERRAPKLGFQRTQQQQGAAGSTPAPQSTGGLSNELMGASPLPDVIKSDEEIREAWLRELGQ